MENMKINIKILLSLLTLALSITVSASSQEIHIRKPVYAGKFYSDDKRKLSNEVEKYLAQVPDLKFRGKVVAIIVPHAGYAFSAPVAAYAYKVIKEQPRKIVIMIGPSHNYRYDYISIFPRGFYETPLGQVSIDEELVNKFISASDKLKYHPFAHYAEHSLEVQLPFLQKIWGANFSIVPILMGDYRWDMVQTLKEVILDNLPEEPFILIASSDMSHYHDYAAAEAIDKESLRLVKDFDIQGLYEKIKSGQCEWCGAGAVLTIMEVARELGADKVRILKYANSGDTAPPWLRDKERVVGYSAIVFYQEDESKEEPKKEERKLLNKEEQQKLLEIARGSIKSALEGNKIPEFNDVSANLKELGGVFVTLNKRGKLRGCIGYPEAVLPLYQAVSQAAISAALKDYRFPPVTSDELSDIDIEISVLSPLEQVSDTNKIEIGKHGLVIRKGIYSGLLLPQVATEYGWNREEFLERICEKAGLPRGAWRDNAELFIFSAQILHEEKK